MHGDQLLICDSCDSMRFNAIQCYSGWEIRDQIASCYVRFLMKWSPREIHRRPTLPPHSKVMMLLPPTPLLVTASSVNCRIPLRMIDLADLHSCANVSVVDSRAAHHSPLRHGLYIQRLDVCGMFGDLAQQTPQLAALRFQNMSTMIRLIRASSSIHVRVQAFAHAAQLAELAEANARSQRSIQSWWRVLPSMELKSCFLPHVATVCPLGPWDLRHLIIHHTG